MTVRSLFALPALALLAACASDPPPRPTPVAAAPPPMPAPAPAPMVTGADGRYAGVARLAAGSPRSCRIRAMNVSANVAGDQVTVMNGRNTMTGTAGPGGTVTFSDGSMSNARIENGMIMGEAMRGECRYNVSLRKVTTRQPVRRGGRAM
ncbi:hypothetical protein ACE7GA_07885 [Roseomonas sp. CCTCC AB2023176]|uniref:hypothetical protein n=1 Tax=Roseomonas sp. CCTCC AB2023176 TaxID=3342640 RepID=UPI0035E2C97B